LAILAIEKQAAPFLHKTCGVQVRAADLTKVTVN
jgi:hypothetical protein